MVFKTIGRFSRTAATVMLAATAWPGACAFSFAEGRNMDVIAQASSGPLRCEIRKATVNGAVELTGAIVSDAALSGQYRYKVAKSGASGSSNINQASKFDLAAGAETRAGQVLINLDRDAHVTVEFQVTSGDGLECVVKTSL